MFNVGRFDPRKEASSSSSKRSSGSKRNNDEKRTAKRRRRSGSDDDDAVKKEGSPPVVREESSLYVIAPVAKGGVSVQRKSGRIEKEAFDDMELDGNNELPIVDASQDKERIDRSIEEKYSPESSTNIKRKNKGSHAPGQQAAADGSDEIRKAIHMASLPIREAAAQWDLAPFLVNNLEKEGFEHFFPIQALVIPDIIASERYSYIRAQDVCVSAATGSGKRLVLW